MRVVVLGISNPWWRCCTVFLIGSVRRVSHGSAAVFLHANTFLHMFRYVVGSTFDTPLLLSQVFFSSSATLTYIHLRRVLLCVYVRHTYIRCTPLQARSEAGMDEATCSHVN